MRRLATPGTALVLGALQLALIVGGLVAAQLAHSFLQSLGVGAAVLLGFTFVGTIVAHRRPALPMGWMMLGVSGLLGLSALGVSYSVLDYRLHAGRLPLGALAALVEPWWLPAFVMLVYTIVLYPDGRAPSRRWRWPLRIVAGLTGLWMAAVSVLVLHFVLRGRVHVLPGGDLYQTDHPTGVWAAGSSLIGLVLAGSALLLIAWLARQTVSFHKLHDERRVQQKWIIAGALVSMFGVLTNVLPYPFSSANNQLTVSTFSSILIAALPVAMGVGILKYRLYEIDRIVSRTVSYAIVTASLVGTFVGLVLLSTRVLPFSSTAGVAGSTLAAAALFNPLRVRVQRVVDRRFNRARYDAEATVAAFASRLRDAVDLDAVQTDLLDVVSRSIEPAHATIWMRRGSA